MTADEALKKARTLLLSEQYQPIVGKALMEATDPAAAAAILVHPIIVGIRKETDLPEEELFGNEEGDGIAIHLLKEVFEIAEAAGFVEAGDEQQARAMAEKAVQVLSELLSGVGEATKQAAQSAQGAPEGQPMQGPPPQNQMQPRQPVGLLAGAA